MNNPFEVLGLKGLASPDEIRSAYRTLARKCHPDMITDPAEKEAAQTRMVALNLAYEEALRLASPRTGSSSVTPELSSAEAILMAQRAMAKDNPEGALRSLVRCEKRDSEWYYMQGKVLMAMEEFDSAHQSFREAVRMDPENNVFRAGALAAAVASGTWSEDDLNAVRELHREAQWFFDFCYVENSEGAHNSELSLRCLDTAEEKIAMAMELLNK